MPNLMDFAPGGRGGLSAPSAGGGLDLQTLIRLLAQAPNLLEGLPEVQTPEPTFDPYGGFAGGAMEGLDMVMLLKRLQALQGNPAARNPMTEGAYQSQRAGERMPFAAPFVP